MELTAVGVAVGGWLVSHLLAIRAQRRTFINQIRNQARQQVGDALRACEDWCSTVSVRLMGLRAAFLDGVPPWTEERWLKVGHELIDLLWDGASQKWQGVIEENEVLFPEFARPRQQLADRQREISDALGEFMNTIWTPTRRREGVEGVQVTANRISEQLALVEYLHVYLQNLVLGDLVRRKRRVPGPRDVSLPRLVSKGRLLSRAQMLEFGMGKPIGRIGLMLARLRYGQLRPILEGDLPDQRELFRQIRVAVQGARLPLSECWIQGEGQHMSGQFLDLKTGRGVWIATGGPDEILDSLHVWLGSQRLLPEKK